MKKCEFFFIKEKVQYIMFPLVLGLCELVV